jgi:hypothetical protein
MTSLAEVSIEFQPGDFRLAQPALDDLLDRNSSAQRCQGGQENGDTQPAALSAACRWRFRSRPSRFLAHTCLQKSGKSR